MSKVIKSEDLIGKQFNNLMVSKVIENDCEKAYKDNNFEMEVRALQDL